jgi:xylulose-5-phosphate/fructose-6-phosphate phosphoketolase
LRGLFRQFSFPGGIPSHLAPETPGSIHEGGELGYALVHAYGAVFDNPDLLAVCVVGDGEAETGPLAASWHSNKFINPAQDGAVLPVLHLNGYKIANPTVLARIGDDKLTELLSGYGYSPRFVVGDDPATVHRLLAATLDEALEDIAAIQARARDTTNTDTDTNTEQPAWPMIVLRTPKGWTGPKEVDGLPVEGTFRAHQVPLAETRTNPEHRAMLEQWMRSYRPEELFDATGRLHPNLQALAPVGGRRMSANPHANGGLLLRDLVMPDFRDLRRSCRTPRRRAQFGHRRSRAVPARHRRPQPGSVPHHGAGRDRLQPALGRLRTDRPRLGRGDRAGRRPPLPRRPGDGGPVRAPVPGLARGLPADRTARPVQLLRGVHPHHRLDVQPARQVAQDHPAHPVASAHRVTELPAVPHVWRQDHNGLSHQDPGFIATSSTRRPKSSASTCRRTPTPSYRWPTTACAAGTTSTSSSPASNRRSRS